MNYPALLTPVLTNPPIAVKATPNSLPVLAIVYLITSGL
jgi:hypothetical protein